LWSTLLSATLAVAAPPFAATQPPAPIRATTATLNGMASPNGLPSEAWFEWSTNTSFISPAIIGYSHTTTPLDVGATHGVVRVSASLGNLRAGFAYRCRLVVSNAAGVSIGFEQHFVTGGTVEQIGGTTTIPQGSANCVAIAASGSHRLALRTNGTIAAWADTPGSYLNVPAGLTDALGICAGEGYSLAIRSDRTVTAWGGNAWGATEVPATLSNAVAVAAGQFYALALRDDGAVVVWSSVYPSFGHLPAGATNIIAIASGQEHILALRDDGLVFAWGNNSFGQTNQPAGLSNVVAISAGRYHSLALRRDGMVVVWGSDQSSNQGGVTNVPAGLNDAVAISMGESHGQAVRANGSATGWGYLGGSSGTFRRIVSMASGPHYYLRLQSDIIPEIQSHPQNRTVAFGTSVAFEIEPNGAWAAAYQWQKNGVDLPFADRSRHVIPFATRATEGNYRVVVSSYFGSSTSSNAHLRVLVPQRIHAITLNPAGGPRLEFSDAVGGGLANPANIELLSATNLLGTGTIWSPVTNGVIALTNGVLRYDATAPAPHSQQFFRISER
jgi:hypothetical protein